MRKLYHYGIYTNGKIYVDEELTDSNMACQGLVHYINNKKAYSYYASSKEICIKKLKNVFIQRIKELEKELNKNKKLLEILGDKENE